MLTDILVLKPGQQPAAVSYAFEKCKPIFNELPGISCCIAGGAIRDLCLTGECHTDWDLFFSNAGQWLEAKPLVLGITKPGVTDAVNTGTSKIVLENNFVCKVDTHLGQIDLCKRTFATVEATVDSFDFTIAAAAFNRKGDFFYHKRFFEDLAHRKLVCHTVSHPMSTLRRLQKYTQKGFTICAGGLLTIAREIQKADLSEQQVFYVD